MRRCTKCGIEKSEDEFGFKSKAKGIRSSWCKDCHSAYTREHYTNNKQYYFDKNDRHTSRIREMVKEKKNVPCTDCGGRFPFPVMDFDHLDGTEKLFNVSRGAGYAAGFAKTLREIEKCEVVCSNCHRMRTYNRMQAPVVERNTH